MKNIKKKTVLYSFITLFVFAGSKINAISWQEAREGAQQRASQAWTGIQNLTGSAENKTAQVLNKGYKLIKQDPEKAAALLGTAVLISGGGLYGKHRSDKKQLKQKNLEKNLSDIADAFNLESLANDPYLFSNESPLEEAGFDRRGREFDE